MQNISQSSEVTDPLKTLIPSSNRIQPTNTLKTSVRSYKIQAPNTNTPDNVKVQGTNSSDIEVISSGRCKTLPLDHVLKQLKLKEHVIRGDGSCLYHAIVHQAGFIE